MSHAGYSAMIAATDRFFEVVGDTRQAGPADVRALGKALDALSLAAAETSGDLEATDVSCPERPDATDARQRMAARFPDFGFYSVADPGAPPGEALVGDAIDDLCDIASDLREVRWLADHGHEADAILAFRFGYESYWGQHLHDLRRYLYFRQFDH